MQFECCTAEAFHGVVCEQYAVVIEVGIRAGLRILSGLELVETSLSYGSWPRRVQDNFVHERMQDDADDIASINEDVGAELISYSTVAFLPLNFARISCFLRRWFSEGLKYSNR